MTIVHHDYRPKRARKKKAAVALTGPRITTLTRRASQQFVAKAGEAHNAVEPDEERATTPPSVKVWQIPETRPVIVTAKNPRRGRFGDVPDMTPEEHERRGDAAVALFRELVRRVNQHD
jgi:hypothetical protein